MSPDGRTTRRTAAALAMFALPRPGLLQRASVLEVRVREGVREVYMELIGVPPLPDELDDLYVSAGEVHVAVRWTGLTGRPPVDGKPVL